MAWHFLDVTWWVTSKCNHIWQVQLLFLWFPAREVVRHKLSFPFDFHWTAVNKTETFIFQDLICLFCHLKKRHACKRYYRTRDKKAKLYYNQCQPAYNRLFRYFPFYSRHSPCYPRCHSVVFWRQLLLLPQALDKFLRNKTYTLHYD